MERPIADLVQELFNPRYVAMKRDLAHQTPIPAPPGDSEAQGRPGGRIVNRDDLARAVEAVFQSGRQLRIYTDFPPDGEYIAGYSKQGLFQCLCRSLGIE